MWHSILVMALALSPPPGPDGPLARPVTVPLRLAGHLPVVRVTVDGAGPFDFAIDTGATASIVDPRLAREGALALAGAVPVVSMRGSRPVTRVRIARLKAGPVDLGTAAPLVLGLASLRALDAKIAGVLGQDVLSGTNLLVDYRGRTVTFDPAGVLARELAGARVPFELADGRPLVRVEADTGRTLRLALDSAAEVCMLFERAPGLLARLRLGHWRPWPIETYLGAKPAAVGELVPLRVGTTKLAGLTAAMMAAPRGERRVEDGLLPLSLLGAVYFDNQRKVLVMLTRS